MASESKLSRSGSPAWVAAMRRQTEALFATAAAEFQERVCPEPNTGCHLWTGCCDNRGYGQLRFRGRRTKAHRVSFELHRGPIQDGMSVLHKCDTPACVNPEHLFLGDQSLNMLDMRVKNRGTSGARSASAKLTESQVRRIRERARIGDTQSALAREFGCKQVTIHQVVSRKTWKHVP